MMGTERKFKAWGVNCFLKSTPDLIYSKHPNTEPPSVFGFNLMPVPIIRISDHLKSGQINPDTSLDRFIVKKIFYSCQNGLD